MEQDAAFQIYQGVKILFNPILWQNPILSYFFLGNVLFFGHFAFNFDIL